MTEKGRKLRRGESLFQFRAFAPRTKARADAAETGQAGDPALLAALKAVRLRLARERQVPAYVIFSDRTLIDMAALRPHDLDSFAQVNGVGAAKLKDFGAVLVSAIAAHRAEAVKQVLHMPEFQAIGAACKRMRNILRQAEEKGMSPAATVEALPDSAEEEKILIAYLERTSPLVEAQRGKREYIEALRLLSTARQPLDAFFDKVMVMVEDARVRANRLALLQALLKEFSTIADFSEIVMEGKA